MSTIRARDGHTPVLPFPAVMMAAVPSSPESAAVRCRGLVKRYADVVAVDGLDLTVARGECFGLLGPNGAGKTTTIEILEGLTPADAGEVEVLGTTWAASASYLREKLGISLQGVGHQPKRAHGRGDFHVLAGVADRDAVAGCIAPGLHVSGNRACF